jgi:hypothetical protein
MNVDTRIPRTDPPLLPWWAYLIPVLMTCGIIVALLIYARQGWHRAEGQATAEDVQIIAAEVESVRQDVEEIRAAARQLRAGYLANRARLESVEAEADAIDGDRPATEHADPMDHDAFP